MEENKLSWVNPRMIKRSLGAYDKSLGTVKSASRMVQ